MLPTWPTAVKIAVLVAISVGLLQLTSENRPVQSQRLLLLPENNLLPRTEHIDSSTIDTRLHQALEEAHDAELLVVFARGRAHGQAGPDDEGKRQPYSGTDLLNDQGVWDLAYYTPAWRSETSAQRQVERYLPCDKHGQEHTELIALEIQILSQASDLVELVVFQMLQKIESAYICIRERLAI
jgi:hypothetical protein